MEKPQKNLKDKNIPQKTALKFYFKGNLKIYIHT